MSCSVNYCVGLYHYRVYLTEDQPIFGIKCYRVIESKRNWEDKVYEVVRVKKQLFAETSYQAVRKFIDAYHSHEGKYWNLRFDAIREKKGEP